MPIISILGDNQPGKYILQNAHITNLKECNIINNVSGSFDILVPYNMAYHNYFNEWFDYTARVFNIERNSWIKTYTKEIMFDCRWIFCHCSMIERPRRINDNLLKISLLYDYDYGEKGSKYEIINTCTDTFRNILNNLIDNL